MPWTVLGTMNILVEKNDTLHAAEVRAIKTKNKSFYIFFNDV